MNIIFVYIIVEIILGCVTGVIVQRYDKNSDVGEYVNSLPLVKKAVLYICLVQLIVVVIPFVLPMMLAYTPKYVKGKGKNDKD